MRRTGPRAVIALVLLLAGSGCAGKAGTQLDPSRLGPARDVVTASLTAMGGLERWRQGGPISAQAVVTLVDPNGQATIWFQRQVIDVAGGRLWCQADTGDGRWKAGVDTRGRLLWGSRISGPDSRRKGQITESLALMLRRVQGPFALLNGPARCVSVQQVRLEGRQLVRVGLEGSPTGETAYYFDSVTSLLTHVTAGPEQGRGGTVTMYEYSTLKGGLTFPTRIHVVTTGSYTLVGEQTVLDVRYDGVEFR